MLTDKGLLRYHRQQNTVTSPKGETISRSKKPIASQEDPFRFFKRTAAIEWNRYAAEATGIDPQLLHRNFL